MKITFPPPIEGQTHWQIGGVAVVDLNGVPDEKAIDKDFDFGS
jgi:hypothetical protein